MKLKSLIILYSAIVITGCNQKTNTSITPSSWIGKVEMGNESPEVVFNIFKDSLGQLAGSLGIPSKGIQGIPLSKVNINKDSIVLESSAAQLIYKGIFEKEGKIISGNWSEPQFTSPLVLKPLTKKIDYDNYKKENTSSLNLEFESEHFLFYSKESDTTVLDNLSITLEKNYTRIIENMQTSFNSKIDVFIYPDLKSFHKAINVTNAPDWVVGAARKNELNIVSPLNPGSEHTYNTLIDAVVHEFAHTVIFNFRKEGLVGLPKWLNEGYAYYEAKQLTKSQRVLIEQQLLNDKIPSWTELDKVDDYQFGNLNGYPISATIIEFLVDSFGYNKLKQLFLEPENIEMIYNKSQKDLEVLWLNYLNQK